MLQSVLLVVAFLTCLLHAAPSTPPLGIQFSKGSSLPTLTLPDATYRATDYNPVSDIYTFSNIRFAAPPVGNLRWAKPAPPAKKSEVQDGRYGNKCPQAPLKGINVFGDLFSNPLTVAFDEFVTKDLLSLATGGGAEDCLFLDVYVPGSAVRNPSRSRLPVVHWIFGGGYLVGAKDQLKDIGLPFYDGSGLVTQSGNNVIFVASNYRLGAFGFLAGSTMEKEGLPNAGLWDQRAALQWTHDNIALLGGDPDTVTAMGESAGAGSIMHHLVAQGGQLRPLFKRAIMQSPAFQPMWDRKGGLEDVFQQYASLAGCAGKGLDCLRAADAGVLYKANVALNEAAIQGSFSVGPAADGSFIRQLASLELLSGNFAKSVDALLTTHTADESTLFVDGHITTDDEFNSFVNVVFPNYTLATGLNAQIQAFYPPASDPSSPYRTELARNTAFVRDSSFTCNTRVLAEAYAPSTPVYSMQYSVTPGWHATDLIPTFWSDGLASSPLGTALALAVPLFTSFANNYKSYLTSFIRSANPNTYRQVNLLQPPLTINWPTVSHLDRERTGNVVDAGDLGFWLVDDDQVPKSHCEFWQQAKAAATIQGGYSPPGSVVPSKLMSGTDGASRNYY